MNKSYPKTNEPLFCRSHSKCMSASAMMCQCNDTVIFTLLAQSNAAMLTECKLSDSAAGLRAVHRGRKKKSLQLWNLLKT